MMCELQGVCRLPYSRARSLLKNEPEPRAQTNYYTSIPVIADRSTRRFDSVRLKDLRKRLDSGQCSQDEIDQVTHDLLDESAEVSAMGFRRVRAKRDKAGERLHW